MADDLTGRSSMFLGGALAPVGLTLSFLRAPHADVVDALVHWRSGLGQTVTAATVAIGAVAHEMQPFQAVWTREIVFDCGPWTAYLNNSINGGDPTAAAPHLAKMLDVDLFVAMHTPRHGPGHATTQLWVLGPGGEPPLMYRRTIAADCVDGRWKWIMSGAPLDFENVQRYSERLVRDRFGRSDLIAALAAVGIRADDPNFYTTGTLLTRRSLPDSLDLSGADLLRKLGWPSA